MVAKDFTGCLAISCRFSGLTGKDFIGVKKTLSDVQEDLLKLFTNETILVGHSLESDLKVLKVCNTD